MLKLKALYGNFISHEFILALYLNALSPYPTYLFYLTTLIPLVATYDSRENTIVTL